MAAEVGSLREALAAVFEVAFVRSVACVSAFVGLEVPQLAESVTAGVAGVGFLVGVGSDVDV